MRSLLIALFIISFNFLANAQKVVNDANAESRTVNSFHAIDISNAFEVILSQDAREGLAVSANNKEDLSGIKTSVDNGVLKIWFDQKGWWPKNRKLKAYIAIKNVDEIKAGGASNIKVDGSISSTALKLDFSGASDLKGKLNVNGLLNIHISGASDVEINGTADEVKIDASGASDVKAYDFTTTNCTVDASGASSIKITVNKELSAKLSGASSVNYKGSAMIRDIKTSGASSISRKS